MALTLSNMMELGTKAPDFSLYDTVSEQNVALSDIKSNVATVIVFICNHCPYVKHLNSKLVEVANEYLKHDVKFIAISSNSVETHPQDGPEFMIQVAEEQSYPFPYLYDETQEVAKAYKAECTPDFFVFNGNMECAYRGRFDETRPNKGVPTGSDLTKALDALIVGEKVSEDQKPSMGCNIKWK
ncbi:MAG: thioredoxin family protein [Dysgonamonadaceae bacterium]|nr:thioredoxin family protein [Dysgonamonadaceae bacterium]MDD4729300.1 thioredoxin family protein [Dysgonamonadaceae bacterium]